MTTLLDANVLIALVVPEHVHHDTATAWWGTRPGTFATCPSTQGSLVRFLLREGRSGAVARRTLEAIVNHPRHVFWADSLRYDEIELERLTGHRQVTDSYLAALARSRDGNVATLDRAFAEQYPGLVQLVTEA